MSLNIPQLQNKIESAIVKYGTKATFSRMASKLGSGNIIIAKSMNDESGITDEVQKVVYMSNTVKFVPKVGDDMLCNKVSYHINKVDDYSPSGIAIAYKMVVV